MNIQQLFPVQKVLRDEIIKKHGLDGQDLLPNLILALQVELGELANEWRGFKQWSKDQEPRISEPIYSVDRLLGYRNPLLEEYADGLSFILEIGLDTYKEYDTELPINFEIYGELEPIKYESITKQFNRLFDNIGYLEDCVGDCELATAGETQGQYKVVVEMYLGLGEMLGFTWEQIEQAYFEKNTINHERQEQGY